MEFDLSKEQSELRRKIIEFAENELDDSILEDDLESRFPEQNWKRCAEHGIQGMSLPERFTGRSDRDFLTAIIAMEGLGFGCRDNGLCFALNAQMWTVQLPMLRFGNDELCETYLPGMSSGEIIGAHAISEPESGSDVFNMKTIARQTEGGYLLNGSKHFVSLAPVADIALVFALTDPAAGKWGVSAFIVEISSAGVSTSENRSKMGLRTVPFGDITFTDCFVPAGNRLGPEGAGLGLSTDSLEWERCSILASQIGAMQRQLDDTIRYAKDRKQFGKPIGKFQSVANRIVEMKLRLETGRLLLYRAAWRKHQGKPAMLDAALLKLHLGEAFVASSLDAIGVHGGYGYLTASGIERDLRDAVGGTIYAGTSDIQRNIIAGLLGL